ncbi:acyl-CoA dehydrogenase family protein [Chryseolinea sp. H1M3-3]|uniref:acyl-CoA dehydrogenase family protein n=1 Tax=Chryseolinea sp. H1M3-3 TaxID=3034144 RepID=UPI0023EB719F|nr:acyl-CoA dehydrogenase family protein [Chryseolinea sp. H1M3-3]
MDIHALINIAAEISKDTVEAERWQSDRDALWVFKTMAALKETKLTGLVVPRESGGLGQGLYALVRICEELGKGYSSAGLCFGMHCVGSAVISAKATRWQKETYLEPIAEGKHITSLALSEQGSGAHFYFPQTSLLALSKDDFLINGNKTFVTNGSHADSYVVSTMAASEEASPDQFSCIVIDAAVHGMHWGNRWEGLGMRGNSSRSLAITNLKISSNQILGEKGDQLWYIFNVVAPYFLMAMAGTYLGIAETALLEAKTSLLKRTYSYNGTTLAQVSLLQHRYGSLWARVESTRRLIYNAAEQGDNNSPGALCSLLAAKAEVAKTCVDVVNEVMTLVGGVGYQTNSLLAMLMRDARASHIMTPTTDILYTWLGRALLDQPILSD